jgi:glycosyltransferase involved in cell wall biosynthesis
MHVCVDYQAAVTQRAGIGRYTRHLVDALSNTKNTDDLSVFSFDFRRQDDGSIPTNVHQRAVRWCPGRVAQALWKHLHWPPFERFAGAADLYHFTNYVLPPGRRGIRVVSVHDVSFLRLPEFAETRNLQYLRTNIRRTVAEADAIVTLSAFSASEIVELLDVDPARVHAIHIGVAEHIEPPTTDAVAHLRARLKLEEPYLLFVGTIEPRKNLPLLIELYERLTDYDGRLVIAGMPGWKCEPIMEKMTSSARADRIHYLDYVSDSDLPALYAGADLLISPSFYEGFGLPPVEAMLCGTPVIASHTASHPEILGNAATLVSGFEVDDWVEPTRQALERTAGSTAHIENARRHAASFTWAKTAEAHWQLYRSLHEAAA